MGGDAQPREIAAMAHCLRVENDSPAANVPLMECPFSNSGGFPVARAAGSGERATIRSSVSGSMGALPVSG